ncbi:RDD family protein [Aquaspirillum soli]
MEQNITMAGIWRRLGSLLYEVLLLSALILFAGVAFQPLFAWLGQETWLEWVFRLYLLAVLYGYFTWCWRRGGQTLAMKTWRLRLQRQDGYPIDIKTAGLRFAIAAILLIGIPAISYLGWKTRLPFKSAVFAALSWWALPYLWSVWDKDRLFLHDRLAGTVQMYEPRPPRPPRR